MNLDEKQLQEIKAKKEKALEEQQMKKSSAASSKSSFASVDTATSEKNGEAAEKNEKVDGDEDT